MVLGMQYLGITREVAGSSRRPLGLHGGKCHGLKDLGQCGPQLCWIGAGLLSETADPLQALADGGNLGCEHGGLVVDHETGTLSTTPLGSGEDGFSEPPNTAFT